MELHILKSLKVNCSNITSSSSMQLSFINNHDMTAKSVEKHYFIALNVKLHVKIRFKKFYWLLKPFVNAFAYYQYSTSTISYWPPIAPLKKKLPDSWDLVQMVPTSSRKVTQSRWKTPKIENGRFYSRDPNFNKHLLISPK